MWPANFEWALTQLRKWKLLTREWWNWKHMYIWIQRPSASSKMTLPYLYIKTVQWDLVPWLASQTDILSEDWAIMDTEELN